jgi:hypothetical protein
VKLPLCTDLGSVPPPHILNLDISGENTKLTHSHILRANSLYSVHFSSTSHYSHLYSIWWLLWLYCSCSRVNTEWLYSTLPCSETIITYTQVSSGSSLGHNGVTSGIPVQCVCVCVSLLLLPGYSTLLTMPARVSPCG